MKLTFNLILAATVAAVGLCGCKAPMQYKVGNETFSSKQAAMERLAKMLDGYLGEINATKTPVHRSAVVVIPTLDRIKTTGIKFWGRTSAEQKLEMADYTARTIEQNLEFMFRSLEKRQIFDRVSLVHDPAPEKASPGGADYVVYYDNPNPDAAQWYVKAGSWPAPRPIHADQSKTPGAPKTLSWLDYLEETVRNAPAP